jgi:hypothetical protein
MVDNLKGSGDFSIGSKVWPGTSKLVEEMGELQQVLGKLIASAGDTEHWSGDLRAKLVEEIGDVTAAIAFFKGENLTLDESDAVEERHWKKLVLFREWHVNPTKPVVATVTTDSLSTTMTHVLHDGQTLGQRLQRAGLMFMSARARHGADGTRVDLIVCETVEDAEKVNAWAAREGLAVEARVGTVEEIAEWKKWQELV